MKDLKMSWTRENTPPMSKRPSPLMEVERWERSTRGQDRSRRSRGGEAGEKSPKVHAQKKNL